MYQKNVALHTSSLSVRRSFCGGADPETETGFPGTITDCVGTISVGTNPTPEVTGVKYGAKFSAGLDPIVGPTGNDG